MDYSTTSTAASSAIDETIDVNGTTTEILQAIRDHYARVTSSSETLSKKGQTKQTEMSTLFPTLSLSEGPLEKKAAVNQKGVSCRDDRMDKVNEDIVVDVNGDEDAPPNTVEAWELPSIKKTLTNKAIPSIDGPDQPTTKTNAICRQQRRFHNPYASKLRSSYNHRHALVIPGGTSIEGTTDDNDSNINHQDSLHTVAPPTLRPAARADETTPGATAVYPSDPLRQHAAADMRQSSVTNTMEHSSSLSLITSSDIICSAGVAPLIEARLVRDSEVFPSHGPRQNRRPTGETRSQEDGDIESGRTGASPSLGGVNMIYPSNNSNKNNITQAVQVVKEDEIIGHRRKFWPLVRDRRVIAVFILLTMTIVGLIVGFTLLQAQENDELEGKTEFGNQSSLFVTPATIAENEKIANNVLGNLPILSSGPILTPGSAQQVALNWLVNNNVLKNMDHYRIIQRYVLTVLYFSAGGLNTWLNHTGWISHDHECTWFQTDYFVDDIPVTRCSDEGAMRALALENNGLVGTMPPGIGLLSDLGTFFGVRCSIAGLGYRNLTSCLLHVLQNISFYPSTFFIRTFQTV
jgi:hypothetical protein